MIFDEDEIHRVRIALAKKRAKMTPEEAEADRRRSVNHFLQTLAKCDPIKTAHPATSEKKRSTPNAEQWRRSNLLRGGKI